MIRRRRRVRASRPTSGHRPSRRDGASTSWPSRSPPWTRSNNGGSPPPRPGSSSQSRHRHRQGSADRPVAARTIGATGHASRSRSDPAATCTTRQPGSSLARRRRTGRRGADPRVSRTPCLRTVATVAASIPSLFKSSWSPMPADGRRRKQLLRRVGRSARRVADRRDRDSHAAARRAMAHRRADRSSARARECRRRARGRRTPHVAASSTALEGLQRVLGRKRGSAAVAARANCLPGDAADQAGPSTTDHSAVVGELTARKRPTVIEHDLSQLVRRQVRRSDSTRSSARRRRARRRAAPR